MNSNIETETAMLIKKVNRIVAVLSYGGAIFFGIWGMYLYVEFDDIESTVTFIALGIADALLTTLLFVVIDGFALIVKNSAKEEHSQVLPQSEGNISPKIERREPETRSIEKAVATVQTTPSAANVLQPTDGIALGKSNAGNTGMYMYYCVQCDKVFARESSASKMRKYTCQSCHLSLRPLNILASEWALMDEEKQKKAYNWLSWKCTFCGNMISSTPCQYCGR